MRQTTSLFGICAILLSFGIGSLLVPDSTTLRDSSGPTIHQKAEWKRLTRSANCWSPFVIYEACVGTEMHRGKFVDVVIPDLAPRVVAGVMAVVIPGTQFDHRHTSPMLLRSYAQCATSRPFALTEQSDDGGHFTSDQIPLPHKHS